MILRYRHHRQLALNKVALDGIRTGRIRSYALALVAGLLQTIIFWPGVALPAEGEETGFRQVGSLERFPADARALLGTEVVPEPSHPSYGKAAYSLRNGTLLPIPGLRLLLQLWEAPVNGLAATHVVVRDLDSLEITNSFKLGATFQRGGFGGSGGEWMHAVDYEGKRLFLMFGGLAVMDLEDFSVKRVLPIKFEGNVSYQPTHANGVTWDPISRRLWVTWGKEASSTDSYSINYLLRLNPDVEDGSDPARTDIRSKVVDGEPKLLRGCKGPNPGMSQNSSMRYSSKILRWKESLYIPCHRDLQNAAVAILKVDEALNPAIAGRLVVGPSSEAFSVLADQKGGRLHFITADSQDWVWDADKEAFVGFVALGGGPGNVGSSESLSVGLDDEEGRLYLDSKNFGLGFVEARYTPVGQARIFPEFASENLFIPYEMLHVDSRTRRIFALPHGPTRINAGYATAYRIFEVPPPAPYQSVPDPDGNTVDIPESANLTIADFAGSAGGYGIRVIAAGGLVKVIPMPVYNFGTGSPSSIFSYVNSKCGYTDREIAAADISDAKVTSYTAKATALGVFLDHQSQQNLKVPSQCDLESSQVPGFNGVFGTAPGGADALNSALGRDWKPAFASCSVPGTEPESDPGAPPLGRASASCPIDPADYSQRLTADASGDIGGPLLSGTGNSKITIYRDRERGLVSRSESVVKGVTLGLAGAPSSASIAEIRSVAESWSNGRPGGARSSRTVTISGFVGPDGSRCNTCDADSVIEALNTAFVGRAYFRQGVHDERLYQGSPRGAQTAVQKSDVQRDSDRAVVGDGRSEVPGLEIITYNDTPPWGRARQIYQLAGVKTASTYNISCRLGTTESGECAGPPPPSPAGLTITLTDASEERHPLEGGVFALYRDAGGDGLLDELSDELLKLEDGNAALCSTGQDGVGNCTFDGVAPGPYVIHQVAAPQGYMPVEDFAIALEEGFTHRVTFTNLRAAGGIEITLTDDGATPAPLAGGVFEVFADDGNQTQDVSDVKVGACTTGEDGACGFGDVPLGGYLVRQASTPADYLRVEEVQALKIELPGQVARLAYRNGQSGIEAQPPSLSSQPVELVFEDLPPSPPQVSVSSPAPASPPALPKVVGSVAEGIRVLLSSPREAALIASVWMLFLSPLLVGGRRRLLRTMSIEGR